VRASVLVRAVDVTQDPRRLNHHAVIAEASGHGLEERLVRTVLVLVEVGQVGHGDGVRVRAHVGAMGRVRLCVGAAEGRKVREDGEVERGRIGAEDDVHAQSLGLLEDVRVPDVELEERLTGRPSRPAREQRGAAFL